MTDKNNQSTKSLIFQSYHKEVPKIYLTKSSNDLRIQSNKPILSKTQELEFFREFGMLENSKTTPKLFYADSVRNKGSRISMADFLGEKNVRKFVNAAKLTPLKMKLQKKIFLEETKEKADLHVPSSPHKMDENVRLRVLLAKSREDEMVKVRRSSTYNSRSSYKKYL